MTKKTIDRHFGNFNIAGFTYGDGCMALSELKIGSSLRLERELENRFDPYAVAIYFDDQKLGYIPRGENEMIAKFLDLGYSKIFDLRVQRNDFIGNSGNVLFELALFIFRIFITVYVSIRFLRF